MSTVRTRLVPLRKPAVLVREETQSLHQDVKAHSASLPEDNAKPKSAGPRGALSAAVVPGL